MKLLLDTHALIWFANGNPRLPERARELISAEQNDILVSAASAWEIAAKFRRGKLPEAVDLMRDWDDVMRVLDLTDLPVTAEHALRAGLLPIANADPFDRMIAAQALVEGAAAVSNEVGWDAAGVTRVWA